MLKKDIVLDNTEKRVLKVIKTVTEQSNYSDEEILNNDYSITGMLDSILFVTLVVELEEEFDIIIDDDNLVLEKISTFEAIVNLVKELLDGNKR